jgi:hypothetical protein
MVRFKSDQNLYAVRVDRTIHILFGMIDRRGPYRLTPTGPAVLRGRLATVRALTKVAQVRLARA